MNAVEKAINNAGGVKKLADAMGIKYQLLQKWRKRGFVPHYRAAQIEQITDGKVMRHELFPELFEGYQPVKRRRKKPATSHD